VGHVTSISKGGSRKKMNQPCDVSIAIRGIGYQKNFARNRNALKLSQKDLRMNKIIACALFSLATFGVGVLPVAHAMAGEVETKKDIRIPEGKRVDYIVRDGNSFTNLLPCVIKAGKQEIIAYSDLGVYFNYAPRDSADAEECSRGVHFIPKVPVEID
jgi:hypothetical protein